MIRLPDDGRVVASDNMRAITPSMGVADERAAVEWLCAVFTDLNRIAREERRR